MGIVYTGRLNKFYELVKDAPRTCDYVQLTGLGGENERLVKHTEEPWYVTHWNRSGANALRNNITRDTFKSEVERFFSGNVPESVKTAMKWDDFDHKGRTLSVRRIQDTFDAISAEVRPWIREGRGQKDAVMSVTFDDLIRKGKIPDIINRMKAELDYIMSITPASNLVIRSTLEEISALLEKMYDRRGIANPAEILKFGKAMESFRRTSEWITSPGGTRFYKKQFKWAEDSFQAMKALLGLCERAVIKFMPKVRGGTAAYEDIGFRANWLPGGRGKRPDLPDGVRSFWKVEGAEREVEALYEKLKQFKDREGEFPRGSFCKESLIKACENPDEPKRSGDVRLDEILDEVWEELRDAPPSMISQLLEPPEDIAEEGFAVNPVHEFDKDTEAKLSTKMKTPLERIILNRYFASYDQAPVFISRPKKKKRVFGRVVAAEGVNQNWKSFTLYQVLKAFYSASPVWPKNDAPTLGDLFKEAVISRYMKKYGEYDKYKYDEEQQVDDIPVLNVNQELRFQDKPAPDNKELDQRATQFLDDLMEKWWGYLAEHSRISEFLGLTYDQDKVAEFAKVRNVQFQNFDWNDEWEKTWKINPEYENDQELIDLLGKLERPLEKFIVNRLFEEFNMPPIYVNIATGASLPPIEQALRPVKS